MSEQLMYQFFAGIMGVATLFITNYFRSKQSEKNIKDGVKSDVQTMLTDTDKRQTESIEKLEERFNVFEKKFDKITNIIEINDFREQFLLSYKKRQRTYIDKQTCSDELKTFLKAGVLEMSNIFDFILQNKFKCEKEEFKSEIQNSENNLKTKFKDVRCKRYAEIIKFEINNFEFLMEDIKLLENGKRMDKFKELCNNLTFKIISEIIKA